MMLPDPRFKPGTPRHKLVVKTGTGTCSVAPTTALALGSCQWWIQTWNDSGYGPWSDPANFNVPASETWPFGIEFVAVPSGEFQMGSSNGESNELPIHRVIISKSFQLGKFQITQGQWAEVMGSRPSHFQGNDSLPVEMVSWNDIQPFIAKMNALNDGYLYRMPTEAEWEYSCRAGTTGDYAGNLDEMGWYLNNSGNKTHPAGQKQPNAWGLYDMHGNVEEWVQDWYDSNYYSQSPLVDPQGPESGTLRVFRGGGWYNSAYNLRSAFRADIAPNYVGNGVGFRILRTVKRVGPPGKATVLSPSGTIATTVPAYAWNAVTGSTWYQLWVNDATGTGKIQQWYTAAQAGCPTGTGTCSVNPISAVAKGSCQWWVETWNDSGAGPWSDSMSFTVADGSLVKAVLSSPAGVISSTTPTYAWGAVAASSWYQLWVNDSTNSNGKIQIWYTAAQAGCSSGIGTCSVTPEIPLVRGGSQWWIQTWNDLGYGPWSDPLSFTVGTAMEFVTVPLGGFQMGSNGGEIDEKPVHGVAISHSFQLGKFEVTQGQWLTVMGSNPSFFQGDESRPVEQVSWNDVQAFIAQLNNSNDGYLYRLPTEAEWEYAARAGRTSEISGILGDIGWYSANSGNQPHPVGQKQPNAWGLYDMQGNVSEWVQDWYASGYYASSPSTDPPGPLTGSSKVFRGGGWYDIPYYCRFASRGSYVPGYSFYDLGFRLLRTAR